MQLWTQIFATAATLVVLLSGLIRGMGTLEVLTRTLGTYFGAYLVVGTLFLLARTALRSMPDPEGETAGQGGERRGTDGTDAAL